MSRWSLAAALAVCLVSSAAWAETVRFHTTLNGASEVPPNNTKGKGVCDATLDTTTKKFDYTLTYSDLTGPATMAHFHGPAESGANAGVALPITPVTSPAKGNATLTEAQMNDLMAGKWYANVHTAEHPAGEIRGQMTRAH